MSDVFGFLPSAQMVAQLSEGVDPAIALVAKRGRRARKTWANFIVRVC
jgi:hypothetical protein